MQLGLYGPLSLIEGHKSAGVAAACDRVVELSGTVAATDEILETLHGLYSNAIAVGSLDRSHLVATKHAKVSEELGDRASIMDDHLIAGVDAFLHGDEPRAKNRFVKVAEHYILEEDRELADVRGHDPRVTSGGYLIVVEWLLGLPACALATFERTHHLENGAPEIALETIDRTLAEVDSGRERWWLSELHRLRGKVLDNMGRPRDDCIKCFDTAIEIARSQRAKSLELRGEMSRFSVLSSNGRRRETVERLQTIYDSFTEGFDTPDLIAARTLGNLSFAE